jgi:hypothetical protein
VLPSSEDHDAPGSGPATPATPVTDEPAADDGAPDAPVLDDVAPRGP